MTEAIRRAYKHEQNEESMNPMVLFSNEGEPVGRIKTGDQVIFYDIRGEREIELTSAFVCPGFNHFKVSAELESYWTTMIEYDSDLNVDVAFPKIGAIKNTLCEVLSNNGLRQIKIAESEKIIHVSQFFNGKREGCFKGEERKIIPSPENGGNYESFPAMNAKKVADETLIQIEKNRFPFILTNFCNVDVLGHTENKNAILKATNIVDHEMGRVVEKALKKNFIILITADHGTIERYLYSDGSIDTGHTISEVPFLCISNNSSFHVTKKGSLTDVTPTIINLFNLPIPKDMTGTNLIKGLDTYSYNKVLLIILDGWGFNPDSYGNLIQEAETPVFDRLLSNYPNCLLNAAGSSVGLPPDTVGNSEVGHLHLGSGRVIPSDKVRIMNALNNGSFFNNTAFVSAMNQAKQNNVNLHLLGIVSFFSSHGSIEYLLALLKMAKERNVKNVYIHGLLGRRGERPESGAYYIKKIEEEAERLGVGKVVSVIGRYWALDREENWDRIEKTYRMLVFGEGEQVMINNN
jgi:2,3-bisphosphoglycerate-independent phosphoglycerate mutase